MNEEETPNPALEEAKAQHLAALSMYVLKSSGESSVKSLAAYSVELMRIAENTVGGNIDSTLPLICTLCGHNIDLDNIEIVTPDPRISSKIYLGRKVVHKHPRPYYILFSCSHCGKSTRLLQEKEKMIYRPTSTTAAPLLTSCETNRPANKLNSILSKKTRSSSSQSGLIGSTTMNQFGLSIADFIH